ncbi:MAG: sigma factor-like helix-turn-helix DNA-binding protein [bacterium]
MAQITFKPKQVTKKILSGLQERAYDVIHNRFGLGEDAIPKTLESIGQTYGITRERVRQIENAALNSIRKSDAFKSEEAVFSELKELMNAHGKVVNEEVFLNAIAKDKLSQNHIHLYMVLHDAFTKHKEDDEFTTRWSVDDKTTEKVHTSLKELYKSLSDDELIAEADIVNKFILAMKTLNEEYANEEFAKRWLTISKKIGKNPMGEWGSTDSSNVKTRGIKDYAYLVMRKHGSPMHFKEVASAISTTFGKKTHIATCHNELIKDARFVLVGRGVYALKEWGYKPGVVRDVIKELIKKNGPMSKEDIIDAVMKERYLKKNTILVNLQNPKYFKKNKSGQYVVA